MEVRVVARERRHAEQRQQPSSPEVLSLTSAATGAALIDNEGVFETRDEAQSWQRRAAAAPRVSKQVDSVGTGSVHVVARWAMWRSMPSWEAVDLEDQGGHIVARSRRLHPVAAFKTGPGSAGSGVYLSNGPREHWQSVGLGQ